MQEIGGSPKLNALSQEDAARHEVLYRTLSEGLKRCLFKRDGVYRCYGNRIRQDEVLGFEFVEDETVRGPAVFVIMNLRDGRTAEFELDFTGRRLFAEDGASYELSKDEVDVLLLLGGGPTTGAGRLGS